MMLDTNISSEKSTNSIIDSLHAAGNFTSLLADMARTGVWPNLPKCSLTLFAPTDYAYAYAREGYHLEAGGLQEVESLPKEGEPLMQLMLRHFLDKKLLPEEIKKDHEEISLSQMILSLDSEGDVRVLSSQPPHAVRKLSNMFMVNLGPAFTSDGKRVFSSRAYDANITAVLEASDGIIYVIDAVLLQRIPTIVVPDSE